MTERELNATPLSKQAEARLRDQEDWFGLALEAYLLQEVEASLAAQRREKNLSKWEVYVLEQARDLLEALPLSRRYSPEERYQFLTENADLEPEERAEFRLEAPDTEEMLDNLRSWFDLSPEFPELL